MKTISKKRLDIFKQHAEAGERERLQAELTQQRHISAGLRARITRLKKLLHKAVALLVDK